MRPFRLQWARWAMLALATAFAGMLIAGVLLDRNRVRSALAASASILAVALLGALSIVENEQAAQCVLPGMLVPVVLWVVTLLVHEPTMPAGMYLAEAMLGLLVLVIWLADHCKRDLDEPNEVLRWSVHDSDAADPSEVVATVPAWTR